MNLNGLWILDPVSKQSSVSLTLLVLSLLFYLILGVLNIAGTISTMGPFQELFYSSVALYFGRRLSIAGKAFTSDKAEEISDKITN